MIESRQIKEIANKIALLFQPEMIFLFGSYANGDANNDSDIDILVIKDSDTPRHRRSAEIRKALIGNKIPIDILVYTSDEFEKEKDDRFSFMSQAIKNAKVLYARAS